jgi:hypothetical protein
MDEADADEEHARAEKASALDMLAHFTARQFFWIVSRDMVRRLPAGGRWIRTFGPSSGEP